MTPYWKNVRRITFTLKAQNFWSSSIKNVKTFSGKSVNLCWWLSVSWGEELFLSLYYVPFPIQISNTFLHILKFWNEGCVSRSSTLWKTTTEKNDNIKDIPATFMMPNSKTIKFRRRTRPFTTAISKLRRRRTPIFVIGNYVKVASKCQALRKVK